MREAIEAIISQGFDKMALNRMTLLFISYNERSLRLARRLYFVEEGVMSESALFEDEIIRDVMSSLHRGDWRG